NPTPGRAMALPCSEGSPELGHRVNRYDDHGRLTDRQIEFGRFNGAIAQRESIHIDYDQFGNEVRRKETTIQPNCGTNSCGQSEDAQVSEVAYKYDRFGNWTSSASYTLDDEGRRGKPSSISYQKLDYYQ